MQEMQRPDQQERRQMEPRPKSAAPPPRDAPAKAGTRQFGAQPIRSKEPLETE
jgi:hypothetical protein